MRVSLRSRDRGKISFRVSDETTLENDGRHKETLKHTVKISRNYLLGIYTITPIVAIRSPLKSFSLAVPDSILLFFLLFLFFFLRWLRVITRTTLYTRPISNERHRRAKFSLRSRKIARLPQSLESSRANCESRRVSLCMHGGQVFTTFRGLMLLSLFHNDHRRYNTSLLSHANAY